MAVLCILLTVGMLAASSVALSKASAEGLAICSGRAESWYAAESAASRMQWLLMREFELNPDREAGKLPAAASAQLKGERFNADGANHSLQLYGVEAGCRISDMVCGLDAANASASLRSLFRDQGPSRDGRVQEDAETCASRIDDYCDPDDFVRKGGFERSDYEAAGLLGLPRNGPIRFREELALIPGLAALLPEPEDGVLDLFRPIAPNGLPQAAGRPSFMSAKPLLIEKLCKLNAKELDAVLQARAKWKEKGIELKESLAPDLLQKLKGSLGFTESGFYTFEVKGQSGGAAPGSIRMSMRVERQIQGAGIVYYEFLQY